MPFNGLPSTVLARPASGQTLGMIQGLMAQKEKREQEEKDRARRFKSLSEYADAAGIMGKDKSITMSLDELEGSIKGAVYKAAEQERAQKQAQADETHTAQLNRYAMQEEEAARQAEERAQASAGLGEFARRWADNWKAGAAEMAAAGQQPADLARFQREADTVYPLMRSIQANPAMALHPQFKQFLGGLEQFAPNQEEGGPLSFTPVPGAGNVIVSQGGKFRAMTGNPPTSTGDVTERDRFRAAQAIQREINGLMKSSATAYDAKVRAANDRRIQELMAKADELTGEGGGGSVAPAAASAPAIQEGTVIRNPKTGERLQRVGGQWKPIQ